jgi:hypothetical protein
MDLDKSSSANEETPSNNRGWFVRLLYIASFLIIISVSGALNEYLSNSGSSNSVPGGYSQEQLDRIRELANNQQKHIIDLGPGGISAEFPKEPDYEREHFESSWGNVTIDSWSLLDDRAVYVANKRVYPESYLSSHDRFEIIENINTDISSDAELKDYYPVTNEDSRIFEYILEYRLDEVALMDVLILQSEEYVYDVRVVFEDSPQGVRLRDEFFESVTYD